MSETFDDAEVLAEDFRKNFAAKPDPPTETLAVATVPKAEPPVVSIQDQIREVKVADVLAPAMAKLSTLTLTPEQDLVLGEPFPDEVVEVRPHDGLLFIPHILISKRLCRAFGRTGWSMMRTREWVADDKITAEWHMFVHGVWIGESICETKYIRTNPKHSYDDALESTRGAAIRRIAAKCMDCGSQVWDPDYCRIWESRYRKSYRDAKGDTHYSKVIDLAAHKAEVNASTPVKPTPESVKPAPATAPAPAPAPAHRVATQATKDWFLKLLAPMKDQARQYFIDELWLSPEQDLADLDLMDIPTTKSEAADILSKITGTKVTAEDLDMVAAPRKPATPQEEEAWWKHVVVPIPPKGMKRDEYLKNPVTCGQLAQTDSKKFFGYACNWKAEGREWKGKYYPPSKSDLEFRKALDAACEDHGWTKPQ